MTTIGTFDRKPDGSFEGKLETLALQTEIRLTPNGNKHSDKAPDYRAYRNEVEVGAAWHRESNEGAPYLNLALDDPSFAAPISAALFPTEADHDRYVLVWQRSRRD